MTIWKIKVEADQILLDDETNWYEFAAQEIANQCTENPATIGFVFLVRDFARVDGSIQVWTRRAWLQAFARLRVALSSFHSSGVSCLPCWSRFPRAFCDESASRMRV